MEYYCSECRKDISEKVFDYSKENYNKILCRNCQELFESKNYDKKNNFAEDVIKGRIAETLVEELFLTLGWRVFRYGMENTIPGIMELLKGVRSDVAWDIKRMPDFVVQNPKNNQVFFIEVKFRKDGNFNRDDKSLINYPYENAYFILVSKRHIKCISYAELKRGEEIREEDGKYLGNRKEFELDKETIKEFCGFAIKFFEMI